MAKTKNQLTRELELAHKDVSDLKNIIAAMLLRDVKGDLVIPGSLIREADNYGLQVMGMTELPTQGSIYIVIRRKHDGIGIKNDTQEIKRQDIRGRPALLEE